MKTTLQIIILLFSCLIFSQTKDEKIISILKTNGSIESYKSFLIDMTINPLKYSSEKKDSLKLVEIERKLTDQEISKRLSRAFSEVYSENEINEIYNFYNSQTGKKMFSSFEVLDKKFRNSFQDIQSELKPILDKSIAENKKEAEENREVPIPVSKEDGFYSVINFDSSNDKLKDLNLSQNPEVKRNEILEISLSKDELDRNIINLALTKEGAKKFKKLTENNIGKPIAIVLNKMLISAPRVMNEIPNGKIQISGNFTDEDVANFVNSLKK